MSYAIAQTIKKATAADAYWRCQLAHPKFNPMVDSQIQHLAIEHHATEVAKLLGLDVTSVRRRAEKLGVTFLTFAQSSEPTQGEWIHHATVQAYLAGVTPKYLLAGGRRADASLARWKAWKAILDENPKYTIAGVARVSGHHHATVLSGLKKLAQMTVAPKSAAG